jgi:predicted flap endonuclease-1-like 5' DNA nuclease
LSAAKRKLAEDEAQVAAAQKEAANKLSAAESKLAVTENRAMAAEGKLSASQNRATAAESKASEMEGKLANAVGKLSSTEGKIARAESKISTLENKLSVATKAADDKLAAMTNQTAQLQQRLQEAEKKPRAPSPPAGKPLPDVERKQFQANITALKTAAATAKKQLSEAEAKRSAAESKASGYESKITAAEYMLSAAGKDAQTKLDASEKEVADLKLRLQEIDLRLNASTDTNEMTMPAKTRPNRRQLQTPIHRPDRRQKKSSGDQSAIDGPDVNESGTTVEDGSPSLIQCLTEELDRWKRHAHVLGDELKQQRVHHEDDSATTTARSENTPAPQPGSATAKSNADPAAATSPDQGNGAHADEADIVDALTDIRGIGKVIAEKLNEIGIYSFERLVSMTSEDRERIRATVPDFENRMKRFDYEKQARSLRDIKYSAQSQTAGAGNIFSGLPTT